MYICGWILNWRCFFLLVFSKEQIDSCGLHPNKVFPTWMAGNKNSMPLPEFFYFN